MKTRLFFVLFAGTCLSALGQGVDVGSDILVSRSAPIVAERGPHHRIWQTATVTVDEDGLLSTNLNSYTELATGLHFWDADLDQWLDSVAAFEIFPNGAVAQSTQHKLILAPNPNTADAVDLLMADGQRLVSHCLGLSYFDAASGQSVLIAQIKDARGVLAPGNNNVVVYQDVFSDFAADLRYKLTLAGMEQDVILVEQPPRPESFGLDSETTRLEVVTEFIQSPVPSIQEAVIGGESDPRLRPLMAEPDLIDQTIDFGAMRIGQGKAFALPDDPASVIPKSVPVAKHWETIDGRTFLFEAVPYSEIEMFLKDLPAPNQANNATNRVKSLASVVRKLPKLSEAKNTGPVHVAQATARTKGVVLDYTILSGSVGSYTFAGDSTYYVTNDFIVNGSTTFEGGTVIKFLRKTGGFLDGPQVITSGPIICTTTPFRPATLTAVDDDTIGEIISGISTGSTSGHLYGGYTMLYPQCSSATALQNFRIKYAFIGILLGTATPGSPVDYTMSHFQITDCSSPISGIATNITVNARNSLIANATDAVFSYGILRGEHLTVSQVGSLKSIPTNSTIFLTNSLLVSVTNLPPGTYSGSGNQAPSGAPSTVFQTVGAGSYYLLNNTYRDVGVSGINVALAAELKLKTTFPPVEITNDFTAATTLTIQAARDTNTVDLGFHYDPLDWVVSDRLVNNVTLGVTNGSAIGVYGNSGLILTNAAKVISQGSPTNLNRFVRYNQVQEQSNTNWTGGANIRIFKEKWVSGTKPEVRLRFTDLPLLSNGGFRFTGGNQIALIVSTDSQWYGGSMFFNANSTSDAIFALTNSVFERIKIYPGSGTDTLIAYARNNLFRFCDFNLKPASVNSWGWHDNFFDNSTLVQNSNSITNSNNGYLPTSATQLSPTGANNVLLSSFAYASGALGPYYQSSTTLANLGSRNADLAGLFHFTTTTAQTKETNSIVDIGFHYLALNNGVPFDADSDGFPDYLEDRNGNGIVDPGEADWTVANLRVFITEPKSNSNVP
jgi:hypothetical protein